MRVVSVTKSLSVAADDNGISLSQTPLAAGNLTITGALASGGVAQLTSQRQVLFTFAADESARTFTVYGTDDSGKVISEAVTGTNTTAVTVLNYRTVTRISVDAATAGALIVGTNGVGASPPIVFDQYLTPFQLGISMERVSGTVNYTLQNTYDDVVANGPTTTTKWWSHATAASKTADFEASQLVPVKASRILINSGTGSVTGVFVQAGIR